MLYSRIALPFLGLFTSKLDNLYLIYSNSTHANMYINVLMYYIRHMYVLHYDKDVEII